MDSTADEAASQIGVLKENSSKENLADSVSAASVAETGSNTESSVVEDWAAAQQMSSAQVPMNPLISASMEEFLPQEVQTVSQTVLPAQEPATNLQTLLPQDAVKAQTGQNMLAMLSGQQLQPRSSSENVKASVNSGSNPSAMQPATALEAQLFHASQRLGSKIFQQEGNRAVQPSQESIAMNVTGDELVDSEWQERSLLNRPQSAVQQLQLAGISQQIVSNESMRPQEKLVNEILQNATVSITQQGSAEEKRT